MPKNHAFEKEFTKCTKNLTFSKNCELFFPVGKLSIRNGKRRKARNF